jgi:hypothetical protein
MPNAAEFLPDPAARTQPDLATPVLQACIDRAAAGADRVAVIPAGDWIVRTLHLRSHTTLRLEPGAVLKPDPDLSRYPALPRGHNKDRQPYHLIVADGCEGIAIDGGGTIDGCGELFWDGFHPAPLDYFPKARPERISPLLEIRDCRDVRLERFTIRNSPGWTVHTFRSEHVHIHGLVILNHPCGPNTDGLDINGCRHVFISDCRIHGCDDNIILKATRDAGPCEHIVITNCILESLCAAIGLGAETWSSIRNVAVSNCTVLNSIRMLQIILWDGGTVEDVTFTNISGTAMTRRGTDRAIHFDIQQHLGENPELGRMRNIVASNIVCKTRGRILLTAQDGARLENITLRDVVLDFPEVEDPAVTVPRDSSSQLSNFSPEARVARAAVVADNVHGLVLANIHTRWPADAGRIAAPMHALWARNSDIAVDSPFFGPSGESVEAVMAHGSRVRVRE